MQNIYTKRHLNISHNCLMSTFPYETANFVFDEIHISDNMLSEYIVIMPIPQALVTDRQIPSTIKVQKQHKEQ